MEGGNEGVKGGGNNDYWKILAPKNNTQSDTLLAV